MSMINSVNVTPKTYTTVNIAKRVSFSVTEFILNQSITIVCQVINENDIPFITQSFKIEGEEYNNWVNTDDYILNLLLSKLDLQPM